MKNKIVVLNKDIETNIGISFPYVFEKGTTGKVVFIVDKDSGLTMIEIKMNNKVFLFSLNREDFDILC